MSVTFAFIMGLFLGLFGVISHRLGKEHMNKIFRVVRYIMGLLSLILIISFIIYGFYSMITLIISTASLL